MNIKNGTVLLIGELTSEPIIEEVKILGKRYINKLLTSSTDNWKSIAEMLSRNEDNFSHVFMKLTEGAILRCRDQEYFEALKRMCVSMKPYHHEVFVYEDNLKYKFNSELTPFFDEEDEDEEYSRSKDEDNAQLNAIIDYLVGESGVRIVPYNRRLEISISTKAFLKETTKGLLFRLYVKNEQLWSNEIDKLLSLFTDYLKKAKGFNVTLDQTNTKHGHIYSFFCDEESMDSDKFEGTFNEFTNFLDVCANDVNKANRMLLDTTLSSSEIDRIVNRYSREAKRLAIDIKYEQESKMLSLRHRMHSELIDSVQEDTINSMFTYESPESLFDITSTDYVNSFISKVHTVNINNSQILSNVKGIFAKEINGGLIYNEFDEQLISLFKEKASTKFDYMKLKAALEELKDESAPETNRVTALQRLKGFTLKAGTSIGQVGVNLLEKYLEKLFFG